MLAVQEEVDELEWFDAVLDVMRLTWVVLNWPACERSLKAPLN